MARRRQAILQAVPGPITVQSAMTGRTVAEATTTLSLVKAVTCTFPGTYRFRFHMSMGGAGEAQAQIYRNGSAVGIVRKKASGTLEVVEEYGGWSKGDSFQLYGASGGAGLGTLTLSGFQVLGSYNISDMPIPAGKVTTDANVS